MISDFRLTDFMSVRLSLHVQTASHIRDNAVLPYTVFFLIREFVLETARIERTVATGRVPTLDQDEARGRAGTRAYPSCRAFSVGRINGMHY